jgi:hypothetical protein
MAKTQTETPTTPTAAAPQWYEAQHFVGHKPDNAGPWRTGERMTVEQLFPGHDPEWIAAEGLPRLLRLGAIKPVDGPGPTPPPAASPPQFVLNQSRPS